MANFLARYAFGRSGDGKHWMIFAPLAGQGRWWGYQNKKEIINEKQREELERIYQEVLKEMKNEMENK